jgi:uncharacterized RDD family membrane protein YckC
MSSAAQRDERSESYLPTGTEGKAALRQIAAERLAAHRNRRAVVEGLEAQARREQVEAQAAIRLQARREAARAEGHPDVSRVRDVVAARYQQSLSYHEFLAAEAQRAMHQAQAEAEVAARNARAVATAQRQLLEELEQLKEPERCNQPAAGASAGELFGEPAGLEELPLLEIVEPRIVDSGAEAASASTVAIAEGRRSHVENPRAKRKTQDEASFDFSPVLPAAPFTPAQLQVRLHEEMERPLPAATHYAPASRVPVADDELAELEEEIEFRRAPEFSDLVLETQAIPANIIEFPRQLVASRKARPRLAEGPLLADGTPEPQLRIFEVEPEQISVEPEMTALAEAPEWQGLLLGAGQAAETRARLSPQLEAQMHLDQQIYAAPLQRRALSAVIDAFCIVAGLAGFAAVAMKIAGQVLRVAPKPLLGGTLAGTFVLFALIYQLLFFTLNEATPGMRAMRVAFCTFNERSPSRRAIRRRLVSTALAACPLGLGLVWMLLDGDGLGWHDRMSRMYPRSY